MKLTNRCASYNYNNFTVKTTLCYEYQDYSEMLYHKHEMSDINNWLFDDYIKEYQPDNKKYKYYGYYTKIESI